MTFKGILLLTSTLQYFAVVVLCAGLSSDHHHHFLESPKLSHWGQWGKLEHCPSDQIVVGMRLKVHDNQGLKDDTGLNAVKFYCQNPYSSREYSEDVVSITSLVGSAGEWKKEFFCPRGQDGRHVAVGFQLRSESSSGVKDDTAGNNLKLVCSDLYQRQGYTVLEGDGTRRGEWTKQQLCWSGYAICGLQTQVEVTNSMDTTGLNNLKVRCCKVDSPLVDQTPNSNNATQYSGSSEGSSGDDSSSSSASGEIPSSNHPSLGHGHAINSEEGVSEEDAQDNSEEQELTAVDPEPTSFTHDDEDGHSHDESTNHNHLDNPVNLNISRGGDDDHHHLDETAVNVTHSLNDGIKIKANNNDDDNLQDEIARIEPVDNSEAHHEDDLSSTASYSQHIPQDVVNALEDADSSALNATAAEDDDKNVDTNRLAILLHQTEHKSSPRFGEGSTTPVASEASVFRSPIPVVAVMSLIVFYTFSLNL